ncbi:MAG: succinate dehydrogenase, hydrophobic membrane anchor protein [Gammaproteobacteria bacterium]
MSLGGTGLRGWLIQRFSAVYLGIYVVFLTAYFLTHPALTFNEWQLLFSNPWMQIGTAIALVLIGLHAWIGLVIVATDYIKIACLRLGFLGLVLIALFAYLVWGIAILWS